MDVDRRLPQWVCAECGLRLLSYNKLRQRSLRTHQILCDVLNRFNYTNIDDLNWMPEHTESTLTQTFISINEYDPNKEEELGFKSHDVSLKSVEIKIENVDLETKQTNKETDSQNNLDFVSDNNQEDFTSNEEDIALSELYKTKKQQKIKEKTRNKNRGKSHKQNIKVLKSSQKLKEKQSNNHRKEESKSRIGNEKNESQKRLKKKEDGFKKGSNHKHKDSKTKLNREENGSQKILKKKEDSLKKDSNHRQRVSETTDHRQNIIESDSPKMISETTDHRQNKIESDSPKRLSKKEVQSTDRRIKQFPFESMFTVTTMSTEELKAEVFKRKMSANYMNASFQCTDCFKGFCDEDAYDRHRLRHSQEWGSVICDICRNHYPCKRSLARHFSRMHSLRYTCRNCTFVASSRGSALRHGLKHMGKKYQCKQCEMEYVNYTTYLNHLRKSHTSEFICELCGYSFVSALGVRHHKRIIHSRLDHHHMVMEGPQCTTCDIRFATEEAYAKHFKFSAKHVIKAYDVKKKRLNQGIKQPTFCEQCDLKLDSQSAYFAHFKSAHPGVKRTRVRYTYSFMCEQCGRIFKSNIALEEHTRIHRKEKPFVCQQCGRAFTQKIALKMHAAIHDANRTLYPCHLCEKRFTNRNNLKRHVFLHSGARPFECQSCGKTFKTKSEKQTHYEYVHLKKPWPKRDRHRRVVGSASGTDIL